MVSASAFTEVIACVRIASGRVLRSLAVRTVQELLGHKTIGMTVRYSHLAPKHTLAAVERLDAPTGQPTDTSTDTNGLEQVTPEASISQQLVH
jgi:hypothetical protein